MYSHCFNSSQVLSLPGGTILLDYSKNLIDTQSFDQLIKLVYPYIFLNTILG